MTVRGDLWGAGVARAPSCDTFPPKGRRVSSQILLIRRFSLLLVLVFLPRPALYTYLSGRTVRRGSCVVYVRARRHTCVYSLESLVRVVLHGMSVGSLGTRVVSSFLGYCLVRGFSLLLLPIYVRTCVSGIRAPLPRVFMSA